jgi:hypothetical protein
MSGSERFDPKAGPLGNLSQAYFGGLDRMVKSCEPMLKGAGRWNLELIGLATRRSQSWLEMPARLGKCRTPMDVLNEQVRFCQTAAADYTEGWRRLTAAWCACATVPGLDDGTHQQQRDYMTFAEPKEAQSAPKRSERKAA